MVSNFFSPIHKTELLWWKERGLKAQTLQLSGLEEEILKTWTKARLNMACWGWRTGGWDR